MSNPAAREKFPEPLVFVTPPLVALGLKELKVPNAKDAALLPEPVSVGPPECVVNVTLRAPWISAPTPSVPEPTSPDGNALATPINANADRTVERISLFFMF